MNQAVDLRSPRSWCFFRSGGRSLAVGLEAVAEIIEADRLERLPLSPPCVRGFCTYRRDVVPVVRLSDSRRDEQGDADGRLALLILRTEQSPWGIAIDRGGAVVAEATLEESGALNYEGSGAILLGTILRDAMIHAVIDPNATWRRLRESVERWYDSQQARALPHKLESPPSLLGAPA